MDTDDLVYFYMNLNSTMGADDWDLHDGEGDAVVDKTVLHMQYNAADASYSVSNVNLVYM